MMTRLLREAFEDPGVCAVGLEPFGQGDSRVAPVEGAFGAGVTGDTGKASAVV